MRQRRTFHTSSPAALLKLMVTIYSQRHVKAGSWLWDCQGRGKKVSWLNPNQCFHCYLNSHVCIGFKSQKKRWKGQSASLIFDAFSSSISKKSNCKISNTKSNCNFGSKNCSSKTGGKKIISELHANKRHTKNTYWHHCGCQKIVPSGQWQAPSHACAHSVYVH